MNTVVPLRAWSCIIAVLLQSVAVKAYPKPLKNE